MRKRLFLILTCVLSFLLAACSSGNIDKLNGKWVADATESLRLSGETFDNAMAEHIAMAILSTISVDIDAKSKKIAMSIGDEGADVSFNVISDNGKSITLQLDNEDKIIFDFVNDDLVIMRDDQDSSSQVALKRANQ